MSEKVTLKLSPRLLNKIRALMEQDKRSVEDVLQEWIQRYVDEMPVESLSDDEVLSLCEFELNPIARYELRDLLYSHRQRELTHKESARLDELLRVYRRGIVRKAQATEVAIARGLRSYTA